MKVLVTGAAGFIGFHLCKRLIAEGFEVIGLDNINNYYDVNLKYARLNELGINQNDAEVFFNLSHSKLTSTFKFIRMNLEDKKELSKLFIDNNFDVVCNLAAQAGVRYSLENPDTYIQSNIVGFLNILECCRDNQISHLLYASSSSVYGLNKKIPFETTDNVDHPISLYAATKKSNELMAHTYSHLFNIKTTGLRFFTVYGPWGRPDMAMFLFTKAIINDQPIKVYNYGKMERDFTYINDIIEGIYRIIENPSKQKDNYSIYNIGNSNSVKLNDFIDEIEINLKKKAKKELLPIQPGDVEKTWAIVNDLIQEFNYSPKTSIKKGVKEFLDWYQKFYDLSK